METLDDEAFAERRQLSFSYVKGNEENRVMNSPEVIRSLYPQVHSGYLFINDEGQHCLKLVNGGGFGHWGVLIGPAEMEVPLRKFGSYGEIRIKLEDGVFVWCD
jgi:hypothetical protein